MSKADEQNQPTEEQVNEANAAEEQRWQGDFKEEDLKIPYKNEEKKSEDGKGKSSGESANGATNSDTASNKGDGVASDKDVENEKVPEVYSDPEPILTTQDPGEYKAADYSFKITLSDGKTKTIKTFEQAEELAEDPDNFETPKQLMDFIHKSTKMQNKLDKDYDDYKQRKQTFEQQSEAEKERQETISGYAGEFEYLAEKGLIPKLSAELQTADWQDPDVAKDKDVAVYNQILDYLLKENRLRAKANVKPLTSIVDAYNGWKLETGSKIQEKEDKRKEDGDMRKAAGARVAGVSPAQQGTHVPKGIAVGNPNMLKRGSAVWED